jgi:hypothetical protein
MILNGVYIANNSIEHMVFITSRFDLCTAKVWLKNGSLREVECSEKQFKKAIRKLDFWEKA